MSGKIIILEALNFGLGRMVQAAEELGVELVLFTKDRSRFLYELKSIKSDLLTITDIDTTDADAVIATARKLNPVGIINPTDYWTDLSLRLASEFNLPSQAPQGVRNCRDKSALRNILYDAGLSSGRAIMVDQNTDRTALAAELSRPAILKDRSGTGSRNVWLVENADDLNGALDEAFSQPDARPLTLEPYFRGTLYSAETVSSGGEMRMYALSGRLMSPEPKFTEEAVITPLDCPEAEFQKISDWISQVLTAVGYSDGMAHTEFMMTADGFEIVEINTRIGGTLLGELVCRSYDENIYQAFLELALGRRPALLDVALNGGDRYAVKLLYPPYAGRLQKVTGIDRMKNFPGSPEYYEVISAGDYIEFPHDDRGCLGTIFASGNTSIQATMNIVSAANAISIEMYPKAKS